MNYNMDLLKSGMEELNLPFSPDKEKKFIKYFELLVETNKVMNLTAITDFKQVVVKHFLDSLLIVKIIDLNNYSRIIDIGTGAGFPGIPLKIMFPHLKITLLDSLNKRVKFLNNIVDELELDNINSIHGRAEDLGHNVKFREKYEICVSRAVANLATLSEYCIPFVSLDGLFISYKSAECSEEIINAKNAIRILGGKMILNKKVDLPCSDMERTMAVIKKEKKTGKKYPRRAGIPSKEPIK